MDTVTPIKRKPGRPRKNPAPVVASETYEPAKLAKDIAKVMPRKKVRGAAMPTPEELPTEETPIEALRRITRQHANWTQKSVAVISMQADRVNKTTGALIPCTLPPDIRAQMEASGEAIKRECKRLEGLMLGQLVKLPIYTEFLAKVYGCGPVVASYLCANIDIRHGGKDGHERRDGSKADLRDPAATKLSHIIRYCGYAVDNETGRLERRRVGHKLGYNADIRTRLFQWHSAMFKNSFKKNAERPFGTDSKYLELTRNTLHRLRTSPDFDAKKNLYKGRKGGKGITNSKARCKAIHLLLEDLYIVWRAIEGLPVWPSFYSAKMGYSHGGMPCQVGPRMLTIKEALAIVEVDKAAGYARKDMPEAVAALEKEAEEEGDEGTE